MSPALVGILDWGIGGIECYRLLKRAHPDTPVLYWSDTGVTPYGKQGANGLAARVQHVITQLIALGASHVILACNAASTVLAQIECSVPCTGVIEPAVRLVHHGFQGHLAILGGARTIRSGLHRRMLLRQGVRSLGRIAQPLSAHIEGGSVGSERYRHDLERIMRPLTRVDSLLLACTHYAAIATDIQALCPKARLLDPVPELVAHIGKQWTLPTGRAPDRFVTTGHPAAMWKAAARVWNVSLPVCERITTD